MRAYTAVQLVEVALFTAVLGYALLPTPEKHPSLAMLAGGLLAGKAILNILAPEGGTVMRRSLIGYGAGVLIAVVGIVLVRST